MPHLHKALSHSAAHRRPETSQSNDLVKFVMLSKDKNVNNLCEEEAAWVETIPRKKA